MKRPRLILALAALQLVLGACYMGCAIYLIHVTTTPETMNDKDAPEAIKGLLIGAAACGVMGFGTLASCFGLWLVAAWGRWLAVFMNGVGLAIFTYNLFDQSHLDWDDIALPIIALLTLIPFLFPMVGRALKNSASPATIPSATVEGPNV